MGQDNGDRGRAEGSPVLKNRNNYCNPGQGPLEGVWRLMRYLWSRSSLPMVKKCHRVPYGTGVDVFRQREADGSHRVSFMGYCRCSSAWACPLCTPRNRRRRSELLAADLIGAVVAGRGLVFLTFTLPHDQGTDLGRLFGAVTRAWNDVRNDRAVRAFFGEYGVDFARCTEVTWGVNGFHPHLHVAVVLAEPLTREQVQELRRICFAPWCRSVERSGFRPPKFKFGVHAINCLRDVVDPGAIGRYLAKIQGLANEMTRMDRKTRGKTIGPFEVLRRAADGDPQMAAVWHDYEQGTKGKRAMTFSETWRERVSSLDHGSDEELSVPDVSCAEWVGMLANDEALALARIPDGHEVFMDLIGDESPECFAKAVEWLCLEVERLNPDDPFYSTFRGRHLLTGGFRGELPDEFALADARLAHLAAEGRQEVLFR